MCPPALINESAIGVRLERDERGFVQRFTWDPSDCLLTRTESGLQGPDSALVCALPGGVLRAERSDVRVIRRRPIPSSHAAQ